MSDVAFSPLIDYPGTVFAPTDDALKEMVEDLELEGDIASAAPTLAEVSGAKGLTGAHGMWVRSTHRVYYDTLKRNKERQNVAYHEMARLCLLVLCRLLGVDVVLEPEWIDSRNDEAMSLPQSNIEEPGIRVLGYPIPFTSISAGLLPFAMLYRPLPSALRRFCLATT